MFLFQEVRFQIQKMSSQQQQPPPSQPSPPSQPNVFQKDLLQVLLAKQKLMGSEQEIMLGQDQSDMMLGQAGMSQRMASQQLDMYTQNTMSSPQRGSSPHQGMPQMAHDMASDMIGFTHDQNQNHIQVWGLHFVPLV